MLSMMGPRILNLLTKIVTAPFAALGALFGGGEDMQFVDFNAGSAELPVDPLVEDPRRRKEIQ